MWLATVAFYFITTIKQVVLQLMIYELVALPVLLIIVILELRGGIAKNVGGLLVGTMSGAKC